MKRVFSTFTAILLCAALIGTAGAQQYTQHYKWIDRDGKVQYGDVPPPGVNAKRLRSSGAEPVAPAAKTETNTGAAKDASKGPLTPAEQEAEYRKRQLDAQKSREKEDKATEEAQAKRANCTSAREQLRLLESGQRYSRIDAKGERYFPDDDQRAAEIAKARKQAGEWCS
jgi:predicted small lipoprotein YifL